MKQNILLKEDTETPSTLAVLFPTETDISMSWIETRLGTLGKMELCVLIILRTVVICPLTSYPYKTWPEHAAFSRKLCVGNKCPEMSMAANHHSTTHRP